jgi:hypothetical protein
MSEFCCNCGRYGAYCRCGTHNQADRSPGAAVIGRAIAASPEPPEDLGRAKGPTAGGGKKRAAGQSSQRAAAQNWADKDDELDSELCDPDDEDCNELEANQYQMQGPPTGAMDHAALNPLNDPDEDEEAEDDDNGDDKDEDETDDLYPTRNTEVKTVRPYAIYDDDDLCLPHAAVENTKAEGSNATATGDGSWKGSCQAGGEEDHKFADEEEDYADSENEAQAAEYDDDYPWDRRGQDGRDSHPDSAAAARGFADTSRQYDRDRRSFGRPDRSFDEPDVDQSERGQSVQKGQQISVHTRNGWHPPDREDLGLAEGRPLTRNELSGEIAYRYRLGEREQVRFHCQTDLPFSQLAANARQGVVADEPLPQRDVMGNVMRHAARRLEQLASSR